MIFLEDKFLVRSLYELIFFNNGNVIVYEFLSDKIASKREGFHAIYSSHLCCFFLK
jgi:hypothetical protein